MTAPSQTRSSIIWADKVALGLVVFAGVVLAAFWSVAFAIIGGDGARHLWSRIGALSVDLALLGLMASWLLLRTLDFLAGGSTFRLMAGSAHAIMSVIGKGGSRMARLAHLHGAQIAR